MYIYNILYNYYIHYIIHLFTHQGRLQQVSVCSLPHTIPTIIYKTGKEDLEQPPAPLYFAVTLSRVTFLPPKARHDTHSHASRHEALCIVFMPPSPHDKRTAPSIPLKGEESERGTLFLANSHSARGICYICSE